MAEPHHRLSLKLMGRQFKIRRESLSTCGALPTSSRRTTCLPSPRYVATPSSPDHWVPMSTRIQERRDRAEDALHGGKKRREKEKKKERMWEEEASSGVAKGRDSARLRHLLRPARPRRVKKRHQWPLRRGLLTSWLTSSRRKRWILECHGTTAQKHHQWLCSRDGMGLHLVHHKDLHLKDYNKVHLVHNMVHKAYNKGYNMDAIARRRTSRCGQHGTTSRSCCW